MTDEAIRCGLHRHHRGSPTSGLVMRSDPDLGLVTVILNKSGDTQVYLERFWTLQKPQNGVTKEEV